MRYTDLTPPNENNLDELDGIFPNLPMIAKGGDDGLPSMVPMTEAPQYAQETSFGLDNRAYNQTTAKKMLANHHTVLGTMGGGQLIEADSTVALIMMRSEPVVVYYVKLDGLTVGSLSVTQVKVWRGDGAPSGITKKIFFRLLKIKPVIMSDSMQTIRGKDFWKDRMRDGVNDNLNVGLADLTENIVSWFDPHIQSYDAWLADHEDAWGYEDAHKDFRFLISR